MDTAPRNQWKKEALISQENAGGTLNFSIGVAMFVVGIEANLRWYSYASIYL